MSARLVLLLGAAWALSGCATFNNFVSDAEGAGKSLLAEFKSDTDSAVSDYDYLYTDRGQYIAADLAANANGSMKKYSQVAINTKMSNEYGYLENQLRKEGYAVALRKSSKDMIESDTPIVFSVHDMGEDGLTHGLLCIGDDVRIGRFYSVSDEMILNESPISYQGVQHGRL